MKALSNDWPFNCRTKPRERSSSSSSINNWHNKDSRRKRSPSEEKDSYRVKRQRHDIENNKVHENSAQDCLSGSLVENGEDAVVNGVKAHQCSCNEKGDDGKRETDISRFYDPEPRV